MSQQQLAEQAGLIQVTISLIETGQVRPRLSTQKSIEEVLGRKIDWVTTFERRRNYSPDEEARLERDIARLLYRTIFQPFERRKRIISLLREHLTYFEKQEREAKILDEQNRAHS